MQDARRVTTNKLRSFFAERDTGRLAALRLALDWNGLRLFSDAAGSIEG